MKFIISTINAAILRRKLSGWIVNDKNSLLSPSRVILCQFTEKRVLIFLRNTTSSDSGFTRLENWRADTWTRLSDPSSIMELWVKALQRIEDFQTAAQVAIILSELGVLPKENTLSAPVDANTSQ